MLVESVPTLILKIGATTGNRPSPPLPTVPKRPPLSAPQRVVAYTEVAVLVHFRMSVSSLYDETSMGSLTPCASGPALPLRVPSVIFVHFGVVSQHAPAALPLLPSALAFFSGWSAPCAQ